MRGGDTEGGSQRIHCLRCGRCHRFGSCRLISEAGQCCSEGGLEGAAANGTPLAILTNGLANTLCNPDIAGVGTQLRFHSHPIRVVFYLEQPRPGIEWNEEREVLSEPSCDCDCALKCWNFAAIHRAHAGSEIVGVIDPFISHFNDDSESISVVVVDVILDAVNAYHEATALHTHLIAHADTSRKPPYPPYLKRTPTGSSIWCEIQCGHEWPSGVKKAGCVECQRRCCLLAGGSESALATMEATAKSMEL